MLNSKFKIKNSKFGGWIALFFLLQVVAWAQSPASSPTAVVPHRVISLSPNFTEIIYDIGAQDQ
ncbi:MAG TPA: hypothetical protein VJ873_02305, partial [bacterium]|nr:hypothetical protein [bacterium]